MSSYIIAGSADSIDTAYCQEIARRISSKYKNIDFRIVIKHPSEWELYLQQICRIYGFLKKSNPIIYTFDGKVIGGRDSFVQTAIKYFGLDEQLLIAQNISSKINMKLAQEEMKVKKIVKSGAKTYMQKVDNKYKELLTKKILKYNLKEKETFLVNGIEYIRRYLDAVPTMNFTKNAQIPLLKEEVHPQEINLMALSLNDQIKPQEPILIPTNDRQRHAPSEQDRLSEATKSNKMHESIISENKDSKGVKESKQNKLRIDEENDDVPDYVDYPYAQNAICELADNFYIAFDPKSLIGQEILFYHNEDPTGNNLRQHNDGRPIKGHRVLIKEVHYDNQNLIQDLGQNQMEENEQGQKNADMEIDDLEGTENIIKIEKTKTQPNIPAVESQKIITAKSNKHVQDDAISQPHSDLNLISHLNHHTLFIHKPLSILQLKNLLFFVNQTNTIGTLQFLPENPNPRVALYVRKYLLRDEGQNAEMPTQKFIEKQLEEGQFTEITIPSDKGVLLTEEIDTFKVKVIHSLGFNHFILDLVERDQERIHKLIKYTIDHMLSIEEQVKHDIGYNLIFTKKRIIIVPLVQPYDIYDGKKLYLCGLSFLGYLHVAKLEKSYEISKPKVGNQDKGVQIRQMLAKSSGCKEQE